jgi:hypothetical protein
MTISLAFTAPTLVKAAIERRLPRGIGVAALRDAPAEWSLQFDISAREYAAAQRIFASRHRFVRKISHKSFKRQTAANFFV